MDVVRRIRDFNAGRDPERLAMKYSNMRASPFVFLRGTCHLFYDRLPRGGLFRSAPLGWVCGDLHLENFGSFKGDNRLVYFDINDFDESALAPVSWDLVRLLASVWVGADSLSLSGSEAHRLCDGFIAAYAASLAGGKAYWVERDTAKGLVGELLDGLRGRQRSEYLDSRTVTEGKHRRLRVEDRKKALPATKKQRAKVEDFMARFARNQPDPSFYEVRDVARRIAGTGSLGVERYVILVEGKGSPDGNYLLDLKRSTPSSLVPHLRVAQPAWVSEAHRTVALQRRLQAVSMAFLQPVRLGKTAFVLRGLQPAEDRVELDRSRQSMPELQNVLELMGKMVAWSQLRSAGREGSANADALVAFGERRKWREPLLEASRDCATQVRKDWRSYCEAFDDKAFELG